MERIVDLLKIMVAIVVTFTTSVNANADARDLTPKRYIEYTCNGVKYQLNNGEATVYASEEGLVNVTIPSKVIYNGKTYVVTTIGDCAFHLWGAINDISIVPTIESVILPNTIIKIGDNAFSGQSKLRAINIPNSVKFIGYNAFAYCNELQSIHIPEGIEIIDNSTFSQCYSLKTVTLPSTLKKINNFGFDGCINLEKVEILNPLTEISEVAFSGCDKIDVTKFNCVITSKSPKRIVVVFNKDGMIKRIVSTIIQSYFKTKEEAEKCYIGEYEYGKEKETFIKRNKLIYW